MLTQQNVLKILVPLSRKRHRGQKIERERDSEMTDKRRDEDGKLEAETEIER